MENGNIDDFIKKTRLVDRNLIILLTETSAQLIQPDLSDSKRLHIIIHTLKTTSQNFYELASKTPFKDQDRELFWQNLMILAVILRTAFSLEWFKNKKVIDWSNQLTQNEQVCDNLFYKAIRVLNLDLNTELLVLYEQLNSMPLKESSDWIFFIHMVSLSHDYFQLKMSQIEKLISTGHDLCNSSVYTMKVLQINQLRRKTLVSHYNQTCEARFEDRFFFVAGELLDWERVENLRNLADLTPLAYKSELDSNLL